jgi:hypothetical protein
MDEEMIDATQYDADDIRISFNPNDVDKAETGMDEIFNFVHAGFGLVNIVRIKRNANIICVVLRCIDHLTWR